MVNDNFMILEPSIKIADTNQYALAPNKSPIATPDRLLIEDSADLFKKKYSAISDVADAVQPLELTRGCVLPYTPITGGNSTRVAQSNFDGGAYMAVGKMKMNRIGFYVTSYTSGVLRLLMFQRSDGLNGNSIPRIMTITGFNPGGTGLKFATPSEGDVTIMPGILWVLWGLESGSGLTLNTFATPAAPGVRMFNSADLNAAGVGLCPSQFTTTIPSNTTPATIDPRTTADGGNTTPAATDVTVQFRLKRV